MKNPFEELWEGLHPSGSGEPVFKRVDEQHPLDFYVGRDFDGGRLLMFLTETEPEKFPQSKAIEVIHFVRSDKRWAIVFRLIDAELTNMFSYLCGDLIESSRQCPADNGPSFLLSRYLRWRKLFDKKRTGVLDESALRGLLGELLFLQESAANYGYSDSVKAWMGPEGADQDFQFSEKWCEVKTVHPGASYVSISSVEQLDVEQGSCGELVVVSLDKASQLEPGAITISKLVESIRDALSLHPGSRVVFEEKLYSANYRDLPDYEERWYKAEAMTRFKVNDDFPKIRRDELDPAITTVRYQLSISALKDFRIS